MIGVVNYGIGNLQSVSNALQAAGAAHAVIADPDEVPRFDKLIVPGVGAFGACITALTEKGFKDPLIAHARSGKPLLGICVGMQMLADQGTEFGEHPGLGLIAGTVVQIPRTSSDIRLPHVGWNTLQLTRACALTNDLPKEPSAYFVHSFYFQAVNEPDVVAIVDYGSRLTAVVANRNVFGVQFHPEKSQVVGLAVLRNFVSL